MPDETLGTVELSKLTESSSNPRRSVNGLALAELVTSVRDHGVLQPILVRRMPAGKFEVVAGHRRFAAAKKAGLTEIPAMFRTLTDKEVLEIQVIENLQRSDLHPLEEAQGYFQLQRHGYDVARIAERIARSVKYVYDRLKLLSLTKPVQKLFLEDRITAGHAIILARLKPVDQARAIDVENANHYGQGSAPLFQQENSLFTPEQEEASDSGDDPYHGLKVRSVRELQAWVDRNVRFDPAAEDVPDLFPETHEVVGQAKQEAEKIINITHDFHVNPTAKDGSRIFGPTSWTQATEKPCEHSVTGVIVIGPGRGEAFKVCVAKEKCKVHWAQWQRDRAKRRTSVSKSGSTGEDRYAAEERRRKAEHERLELEGKRRVKATPAILEEIAKAITKAPAGSTGPLGDLLAAAIHGRSYGMKKPSAAVPRGKTAEDLVRHLAFNLLYGNSDRWRWEEFSKMARAVGVNVAAIVDREVPKVQTPAVSAPKQAKKK